MQLKSTKNNTLCSYSIPIFLLVESKYRNLCAACDNPVGCYTNDAYYGREGALFCLTDNAGDIAWVRLNDTLLHFKVEGLISDKQMTIRNNARMKKNERAEILSLFKHVP